MLQVNKRATGQTIFAHKEEHSLIGTLKQWAVGNPGNPDWRLKWDSLLPVTLDGVSIRVSIFSGDFLLAVKCISLRPYRMLPKEQHSHCFHLRGQVFTRVSAAIP